MNVVKCLNGHFFDRDKYSKCPHCGEISQSREIFVSENKAPAETKPDSDPSISLGDFMSDDTAEKLFTPVSEENTGITDALMWKELQASEESTLQKEIRDASASSEDKTLGYFSRMYEGQEPVSAWEKTVRDPVTGWLVCISGPHFGETFPISAGNNSIGRGPGNKIVLEKDRSISGEKHASIVYEPKQRKFYLQPGDSSGLTYLNNSFIINTCGLERNAIIEMGISKFIFIPLCGPDFSWEEYLK